MVELVTVRYDSYLLLNYWRPSNAQQAAVLDNAQTPAELFVMPRKPPKSGKSALPPESGAGEPSLWCAPMAGSRRKQRRPHRVLSESEEPAPAAQSEEPTVKQELPSRFAKAAASTTAATSATSSLIAALKSKRAPKPKDVPLVQCGVCKERVNERAFERHALSNHLGLARPAASSQEFTKAEKLSAFGRVLKAGGKLRCSLCEKSLTSALGFYHHQSQCGKEIEPIRCPKCGWFLKPLSLPQHMRKHEKEGRIEDENGQPPKKRSRRSVAKSYDDPDYDADAQNGVPLKRGFSAPRVTPHLNTVAKWQRRLQAEPRLRCEMPGCQHESESVAEMVTHYPQCSSMPAKWKVFSCDQCRAQTGTEAEMLHHIEESHQFELVSECAAGGRDRSPEPAGPRGRPTKRRTGAIVSELAGELTYFTPVERQACAREQAAKYWAQLPRSPLVEAAPQTADWWCCRGDERSCYTPPMKLSPAYKVQEIGNPDPYRSFERLDTFAFEELDNGVLCFCGGPVVACDWCPLPTDCSVDVDARQYLAVSCLPVVDRHLTPVEPSSLAAAVQIWSFTADRRSARMEFAVCVDGGPVWDLAWCPTGGGSTAPPADRLLGSLALACGDGRVRVFTIPAPSTLCPSDDTGPSFYIKRADFRLEVLGDVGRSPCCRLDWAQTEGNRSVACILGNGVVAIWNLETNSAILRETDGPSRVLYPVQLIPAHRGHGTAMSFSPSGDRYLVTGGRDRTQQMWDREEPASLQRATTKLRPMLTDVCWPVATKKLINAYDHSLFVGSPSIMMSDASMPVQDVPFFTHGAKCTSVSVNSAVNGLACSSESGLVALAQWRNMLCHKQKAELRRLLLKLETERLMPPAAGAGGGPEELLLGDKYMQVWESCGVTIWEAKMNQKSGVIREGFDDHVCNTGSWVSNYPFVAVNKVSWNRNLGTDSWLAVGMECGLLRVVQVPAGAFSAVRSS